MADEKTFVVGDVLVVNFTTGLHDVAEVTEAAYESCNATDPMSLATNGPTNITLATAGEHYFICTFDRHCSLGQKLDIDVKAASSPYPSPSPSPPAATPTPTAARTPVTYVVGDALGWLVATSDTYDTWAEDKTFYVGDVLVFNFTTGLHDVAEVTETAYENCNGTSLISFATDGPTNTTLTTAGEHYFICTFSSHCGLGQKLDIDVRAASSPSLAPPVPATSPSSSLALPNPTPSSLPLLQPHYRHHHHQQLPPLQLDHHRQVVLLRHHRVPALHHLFLLLGSQ